MPRKTIGKGLRGKRIQKSMQEKEITNRIQKIGDNEYLTIGSTSYLIRTNGKQKVIIKNGKVVSINKFLKPQF